MGFNTFGQISKTSRAPFQVWAEVSGVKSGGGTLDISSYPTGTVVRAGTPVALDKSGGTLVPVLFYETAKAVLATDTEVLLVGSGVLSATGNIGVVPETFGGDTQGAAYTAGVDNGDGTFSIEIVANALGALDMGEVLAKVSDTTATAKLSNLAKPEGLLWHDIVVEDGDTLATGAIVDVGRIFEDRAPRVPAAYKAFIPSVKFEKGI